MLIMTNPTTDLVAFLRARLDDDEHIARAVEAGEDNHRWHWRTDDDGNIRPAEPRSNDWIAVGPWDCGVGDVGEHIARHDPARVLAEVESKRQILDVHSGTHSCGFLDHDDADPCSTLRLLAQPYSSHPEYREEWRA